MGGFFRKLAMDVYVGKLLPSFYSHLCFLSF